MVLLCKSSNKQTWNRLRQDLLGHIIQVSLDNQRIAELNNRPTTSTSTSQIPPSSSKSMKNQFCCCCCWGCSSAMATSAVFPLQPEAQTALNPLNQRNVASSQMLLCCSCGPAGRKKRRIQSNLNLSHLWSSDSEPAVLPSHCSLTRLDPIDYVNPSLGLKLADLCLSLAATGWCNLPGCEP